MQIALKVLRYLWYQEAIWESGCFSPWWCELQCSRNVGTGSRHGDNP